MKLKIMNIGKKIKTFTNEGAIVIKKVLNNVQIKKLKSELENAIQEDSKRYPNVFDKGMVHNCMVRGTNMALLLDNKVMNYWLGKLFSETCVIYAYQSSSLPPNQKNYGSRIHVDSPRFIKGYTTNLGIFFPLDDFTIKNGATYYLPGSHKSPDIPSEKFFYKNAKRLICKAGDMIIIDARVFHAAGFNSTSTPRHSLTINFCRSFMKTRFDFPRLIPKNILKKLKNKGKQLIGMNVRMPTSLDEFYLPEKKRLYKTNQER
jgi:ectoine hydroxylase-related dioxygenase (phytanoyl-CoA dioxygenase family)